MKRYVLAALGLGLALCTACGGSGNTLGIPTGIPIDLSEVYPTPLRQYEGSVSSTGEVETKAPLRVGDDTLNVSWRAFTSFASVQPGAGQSLESAVLRLHQGGLVGEPYARLGALYVDHVDLGAGLDAADWGAVGSALSADSSDAATGEMEIDVTAIVEEALAQGAARVDMRLRFTLTLFADGVAQQTHFTSYTEVIEPLSLPPILQLTWRNAP